MWQQPARVRGRTCRRLASKGGPHGPPQEPDDLFSELVFLPLRVLESLPILSNDMPGTAFLLAQQTDELGPLLQHETKQGPPTGQIWVEMEARARPPLFHVLTMGAVWEGSGATRPGQGCALSTAPSPAAPHNHVSRGSGRAGLLGVAAWLPCQLQCTL